MTATAVRTEIQSQPVAHPAQRECSHMGCHAAGTERHPAGQGLVACLTHFLVAASERGQS